MIPEKIVAESWLMSVEAIRNRANFEKISETEFNPEIYQSIASWGQFLDGKGNLKKEEIRYLFNNGKPRYNVTKAAIGIEDFFRVYGKKYLGKELISFDDSEKEKEDKRIHGMAQEIKSFLHEKLTEEKYKKVTILMEEHPVYKRFLESEQGPQLLGLINESKLNGIPFKEIVEKGDKFFLKY